MPRVILAVLCAGLPCSSRWRCPPNPSSTPSRRKTWLLTTRQSSYAMGVAADGALRNLYWGSPLWRMDDLASPPPVRDRSSFDPRQVMENEEFPGWGGPRFQEPALKITRPDGVRDLVLKYA